MTQVTSNSSTMTIFAALLCDMAERLQINPMYLMIPCATSVSMAFCLPVSTPPNAVVEQYGEYLLSENFYTKNEIDLYKNMYTKSFYNVQIYGFCQLVPYNSI